MILTKMIRHDHTSLLPNLHRRLNAVDAHLSEEKGGELGVILSYTGLVDSEMIPHFIQLAERALHHSTRTRKEVKRAMAVLIECLQNVIHHGHIDEQGESALFLTMENTPLGYQLHCGNLMNEDDAEMLSGRIAELNNLSHAELRKLYIDVLCDGPQDSSRGNAGLGLISIAKRAAGPIEFFQEPHPSGLTLVTLTTTVRR